jgi:Nucleotidyltransferase/DNA polymerase involved in DNA repair
MDLLEIPGIGKKMKKYLIKLGINEANDLKKSNPEKLYEEYKKLDGVCIDKCVLYIFRSAIYYANNQNISKEQIKWWDFKDK